MNETVDSESADEAGVSPGTATEKPRFGGLGSLASSAVGLLKKGKAVYDDAQRRRQVARFNDTLRQVEEKSDFINPSVIEKIREFEAAVGAYPPALSKFSKDKRMVSLLENAGRRLNFAKLDSDSDKRSYVFTAISGDLLKTIDGKELNSILKGISQRYSASNLGNVVAGSVLASRNNAGGVALALAGSVSTGQHNGEVRRAIFDQIPQVIYSRPAANLSNIHRKYIVFAQRLIFCNIGEKSIVQKALFSLVYDNGSAIPNPPKPHNKFSAILHSEFHNNFLSYIWTVQQAGDMLDSIRVGSDVAEELFDATDLRPIFQRFADPIPTPEMVLSTFK